MDLPQPPFQQLPSHREVTQEGFPEELSEFYQNYEGIGLESSPDNPIRICRLEEAIRISCSELDLLGGEVLEGWESFSAIRLGMSPFFDEIVSVIEAPCCDAGSIMVFGGDIYGPGGKGEYAFECSLVLASSLSEWLDRIAKYDWNDPGLYPGEFEAGGRLEDQRSELVQYYKKLNPQIEW